MTLICRIEKIKVCLFSADREGMKYLIILILCSGCASAGYKQWESERDDYSKMFIDPTCDHNKDPKHFEDSCGIITYNEYDNSGKFFTEYCKPKKIDGRQCGDIFAKQLTNRLALRYPLADGSDISTWCNANVKDCGFENAENASNIEVQLLKSHNKNVLALAKNRMKQLQNEDNQESYERRKAVSESLRSFGDSMSRPTINCKSNTVLGYTNTTCN